MIITNENFHHALMCSEANERTEFSSGWAGDAAELRAQQ